MSCTDEDGGLYQPAPQNTVHVQAGERRLDSVPLYLIQRFLERFDLPDKNQQILKLIGIRHFFLCPHRLRAAKAQNDIPERSVQLSATFNEFSFALSYASNFALNHTLSPEFFFPRVKSFRIHGNRSFQSRIFRKIYADSRFRQNNIPEPLQKKAAQTSMPEPYADSSPCGYLKQACSDKGGGL